MKAVIAQQLSLLQGELRKYSEKIPGSLWIYFQRIIIFLTELTRIKSHHFFLDPSTIWRSVYVALGKILSSIIMPASLEEKMVFLLRAFLLLCEQIILL